MVKKVWGERVDTIHSVVEGGGGSYYNASGPMEE
jgi:hypothetical protein